MLQNLNFLTGLERKLAETLFASGKMTPAGFRRAAKEVLSPEIYASWNAQLLPMRYRSWKGLEAAAKKLHFFSAIEFFGDEKTYCAAKDAANAIYGLIPLIHYPRKRHRSAYDHEWDSLDFCTLCWRLAPAGKTTLKRQPHCAIHQPRTPGYQRARRLKYDLTAAANSRSPHSKYSRYRLPRPEYTESFINVRERMSGATSFQDLLNRLPRIQAAYVGHLKDPVSLLRGMLLDVPDPYGKIAEAIPVLASNQKYFTGIFLHAEVWLMLHANHPHGGKRRSTNRSQYAIKESQT